jgi:hypothetical protein
MRGTIALPLSIALLAMSLACGGGGRGGHGGKGGHGGRDGNGDGDDGGGGGEVTASAAGTPDCVGFCQQTAACWTQEGKTLGPDEQDCQTSCKQPTGSYVHMGAPAFLCATKACGAAFDDCEGNALMSVLSAGMNGGPLDAPADWPAGFPMFYAGTPVPVPAMGAVKSYVFAYPMTPEDLATVTRAELKRTGWSIDSDENAAEEGTSGHVRMSVSKSGASVQVSVYAAEGTTVMQLVY